MLAMQPQKREVTQDSRQVPVAEVKLVEYSFRGIELQKTRVLNTSIEYGSQVKSRVKITDQEIARSEAELSKGNTVTAQTARRGIPVARITPHISTAQISTAQISTAQISTLQNQTTPFAKYEPARQASITPKPSPNIGQMDIFSSLTGPLLARTAANAIGKAIEDILTESPAEKTKRELAEKTAAEAKRQEIQRLQQAALTERNEIATRISTSGAQQTGTQQTGTQQIAAEVAALEGLITSNDIGTIESAIALGKNLEARASAETAIFSPITSAIALNIAPNEATIRQEKAQPLSIEAINILQQTYQTLGAEGIFRSLVLEALTSESPSAESQDTLAMITRSAPAMLEEIIIDLNEIGSKTEHAEQLEAIELSLEDEMQNDTEESQLSADLATPFSLYAEINDYQNELSSFSFPRRGTNEALAA